MSEIKQTSSNNNECIELKNIKYKTMLLNGKQIAETKSSNSISNLDKFLENEKHNNSNEPWCKMSKADKIRKLNDYAELYKSKFNLEEEEYNNLTHFFKDSIDRKKLHRVKDVLYDKNTGIIKDIPGLSYVKANKHFTLKNVDKRVSTLKSLPVKRSHVTTIKNKSVAANVQNDQLSSV